MPHVASDYELVIRPTRGWFHLNLADVWRYRDLLFLLVHRDFVAKYKQTILGPLVYPAAAAHDVCIHRDFQQSG